MAELLSTLNTPAFVARSSVHTPLATVKTKHMLRRAFQYQVDGVCFSLVEVLSTCPTNWGIPPAESLGWLEQNMLPYYPLGVFKTPDGEARAPQPLDP
jgi:2-oxoglutarate ferredoxin oxidoreductase subunit beta